VFQNRVLRSIFGSEGDKVTWEWRKLHNEELYYVYSSPNFIWVIKSRRMGWAEHVECMEVRIDAYRVFLGRPEGGKLLGRPRHRWDGSLKSGIGRYGLDWSSL
jgi:hypothetical protein